MSIDNEPSEGCSMKCCPKDFSVEISAGICYTFPTRKTRKRCWTVQQPQLFRMSWCYRGSMAGVERKRPDVFPGNNSRCCRILPSRKWELPRIAEPALERHLKTSGIPACILRHRAQRIPFPCSRVPSLGGWAWAGNNWCQINSEITICESKTHLNIAR